MLYIIPPISNTKKKKWGMMNMRKMLYIMIIYMIGFLTIPAYADAYNWGMSKGKNGNPAQAGQKFDEMLPKFEALYLGDTTKKDIYLTFDNGYKMVIRLKFLMYLKNIKLLLLFSLQGII